jgi:hypothetical protein
MCLSDPFRIIPYRKDVEVIFSTIERKVKEVKAKFYFPKEEKFKL